MNTFPSEFSDFIRRDATFNFNGHRLGENGDKVRWYPNVLKANTVRQSIQLLDQHLSPYLRNYNVPVPEGLIKNQKRNYTETLPKTFHNDSLFLNGSTSKVNVAAKNIGLLQMLSSRSLHKFAEDSSGYSLDKKAGFQVIRYKAGDYVGPHNDHHPEDWNLRDGYIDFHITLTNPYVENQFFIYESAGKFNRIVKISEPSGITISHLPYWHQVTPLIAAPGKEHLAQRWLLLVSFSINRERSAKRKN